MLVSRADEQGSTLWIPTEVHHQLPTWLQTKWDLSTDFPSPCSSFSPCCGFGSSWSTDWLSLVYMRRALEEQSDPFHLGIWDVGSKRLWDQKWITLAALKAMYLCSVIFKALVKGFNVDKGLQHDGNSLCTGQCEIKTFSEIKSKCLFSFLFSCPDRSCPCFLYFNYISPWYCRNWFIAAFYKSQINANLHMELFQLWLQLWLLFLSSLYSGIPAAFILWAQPVRGLTSHQLSTGWEIIWIQLDSYSTHQWFM